MRKKKELLQKLSLIFEKRVKETDKVNKLQNFDSLIVLLIINLAKTKYKKNINSEKILSCKTISEIIDLII